MQPDILCLQEVPCVERTGTDWLKPTDDFLREAGYSSTTSPAGWIVNNTIYYRIDSGFNPYTHFTTSEKLGASMVGIQNNDHTIWTLHLNAHHPQESGDELFNQFFEQVPQHVQNTSIFTGDFNATLHSATVEQLTGPLNLSDACQGTLPVTSLYGEVIDHILIPTSILPQVKQSGVYYTAMSDHFPVLVDIEESR